MSQLLTLGSSSKITTNDEWEGIWKVMTVVWIKALFQHLPEDTYKNRTQNIGTSGLRLETSTF